MSDERRGAAGDDRPALGDSGDSGDSAERARIADDVRTLHRLGYAQELARRMSGFSNLAISMSIICILAGGVTSYHLGLASVGGASIGIGWPLACLFSLGVALTMGQIASAFPTAGGLYHWAAILGGRGWGWATAWFNLAGLVTVLAAINVGAYRFFAGSFAPDWLDRPWIQTVAVLAITASQAGFNHWGIRLVARLTDFSGYWILLVSAALVVTLLVGAETWDWGRLVEFTNYSGLPEGAPVWPAQSSLVGLFFLGLLLPAYTITGFDASAHVSEETIGAAENVPRGIVRSVLVSGAAGWLLLVACTLALPDLGEAVRRGDGVFHWLIERTVEPIWGRMLLGAIFIAQYLCGLATVTSASRMAFAFARDGGLPGSYWVRRVDPEHRTPTVAIWCVAGAAVAFTVYTPVYSTITAVCTILLYVSYVVPAALGYRAWGRSWRTNGPWTLGRWFKPAAAASVAGCGGLIVIGMQPPNDQAAFVVAAFVAALAIGWFGGVRSRFPGPPRGVLSGWEREALASAEAAVHQEPTDDERTPGS